MRRDIAISHLRVVCQRLDAVDPASFFVIPHGLYIYGSVLTDKPNPADVDLLFLFQEPPDLDPSDIVQRLSYGKPLPIAQAIHHLRRGMKGVHIEPAWMTIEKWLAGRCFPPDTDVRLLWKTGLDWGSVVADIEARPTTWDPGREARNKLLQEEAKRMLRAEGSEATRIWFEHGQTQDGRPTPIAKSLPD